MYPLEFIAGDNIILKCVCFNVQKRQVGLHEKEAKFSNIKLKFLKTTDSRRRPEIRIAEIKYKVHNVEDFE